jgi:glyoxylase-like metal-dependent hydrolase (beta-lactamase superfamily II)
MGLITRQSRFMHYNAGAFVSDDNACLVDPGLVADEIAALAAAIDDAELKYIVLTHADWDHVLGPEHLPRATVVAHARYADDLDPDGIGVVLGRFEEQARIERERPFVPPLPDETFEDDMALELGNIELQLSHAPGHAASMLTIYEPESATLWASDVLSDVEIPSITDDLGSYEQTLDRLAALEIRTLVVGHGTCTEDQHEIGRRLGEDRTYLAEVGTAIADAVAAGRPLEETADACAGISLRRSDGDDEVHRLNVEKVYADLGGDADPEQVGYARAWREMTRR